MREPYGGDDAGRAHEDSARIQHDIDRTRSDMDRTIDELGERLRPSNLLDTAVGWFAGSSTPSATTHSTHSDDAVRRAATNAGTAVWAKVRENPVASAAIAGGLAYMFFKDDARDAMTRSRIRRNSREPQMYGGSYVDARTGRLYDMEHYGQDMDDERHGRGWTGRMASYAGDKASDAAGSAKSGVSRGAGAVADSAKSAASWIGHKVSDAAGSVADAAGHATSDAAHRAGDAASSARHAGARYGRSAGRGAARYGQQGYAWSRERFDDGVHEHPLVMGIASLAAGVLAGLAVPSTRTEDRAFGSQARHARDMATDAAGEAYERGKHVVERGMETAEEEARRQGVHPSQLKEEAGHLAGRVKEAAKHVVDDAKRAGSQMAVEMKDDIKNEAGRVGDDAKGRDLTPGSLAESAKAVAGATKQAVVDEAKHQKDEAKRQHGKA